MAISPAVEAPRAYPEAQVLTPIPVPSASASAAKGGEYTPLTMYAEGSDEPSFWDLLDVINPLQHIPIISDIYREITGDKIGAGARVAGGALFGGVIGLGAAIVNLVVQDSTGRDIGEHALALFQDNPPEAAPTKLADASDASQPAQVATDAGATPLALAQPQEATKPAETQTPTTAAPISVTPPSPKLPEVADRPQNVAPPTVPMLPLGFGPVAETLAPPNAPIAAKLSQGTPPNPPPVSQPARTMPVSLLGAQMASPLQLTTVQEAAQTATTQTSAAQTSAAQAAAAQVTGASGMRPLSRPGMNQNRFMPLPPRATGSPNSAAASPASGTSAAQPAAVQAAPQSPAAGLDPAAAQRVLTEQGFAQAQNPMLPQGTQGETSPDWFAANMMRALDKYEQSNRLNSGRR